jgi:uncharacterized membrane protein
MATITLMVTIMATAKARHVILILLGNALLTVYILVPIVSFLNLEGVILTIVVLILPRHLNQRNATLTRTRPIPQNVQVDTPVKHSSEAARRM